MTSSVTNGHDSGPSAQVLRVLVLGYGNPGRLDDGLGVACADRLEVLDLSGVTVEADYQLTVENAEAIARHDAVVFVDACVAGTEPFSFESVVPDDEVVVSYTSHYLEPGSVMALARDLFDADAPAYALAIRGYDFNEFGQALSDRAASNLDAAMRFLTRTLRDGNLAAATGNPDAAARDSATLTGNPAKQASNPLAPATDPATDPSANPADRDAG